MKSFFTSKRASSDDLMNTTIFPKLSKLSQIESYQPSSPPHKVTHHKTIIDDILKSHQDPYKEHRFIERGPLSYRQIRYKKVNEEPSQIKILSKDEVIQKQSKDNNSKQQLKQWAANKKLLILSDEKLNSSHYSQNLLLPLTNRSHSNSQYSSKIPPTKNNGLELVQSSARSKLKEELSCFQSPLVQRSNNMLTRQQLNVQSIAKETKQDNNTFFKQRKSIKDNENDEDSQENLSFMYKILNSHSRPLLLQNHSPKLSKHNFLHGRRMPSYFHKS